MNSYYSYQKFLRDRYGFDLYRVPLDPGFGCPHRDPKTGTGGCIFCGADGSRAAQLGGSTTIRDQVAKGVDFARARYGASAFLAYFQAYTTTYAKAEVFAAAIQEAQSQADFQGFIFGTRPDCLSESVLELLQSLSSNYDVWVELGVQTAHDATLKLLNRGHDVACSDAAARKLAARGINVAAHVILGLPGEEREDFRATAAWLRNRPFGGVKIHNLHVIKNTVLADWWHAQNARSQLKSRNPEDAQPRVTTWDEHEYGEVLMDFLRRIPPKWPVMRLVSDTSPDRLVAPRWWMSKADFLNYVQKQMEKRGWRQGDLLPVSSAMPARLTERRASTAEFALASPIRPEAVENTRQYHIAIALANTTLANLPGNNGKKGRRVLDIGLGKNWGALALMSGANENEALTIDCRIPAPARLAEQLPQCREWRLYCETLLQRHEAVSGDISAVIRSGDPRLTLRGCENSYDAVILEPSNVEKAPQWHTVEFCQLLAQALTPGGAVISPSSSNIFRAALILAGFRVGISKKNALRRGGTVGVLPPTIVRNPLPPGDKKALADPVLKRPFHDPDLQWSRRQILQRRNAAHRTA